MTISEALNIVALVVSAFAAVLLPLFGWQGARHIRRVDDHGKRLDAIDKHYAEQTSTLDKKIASLAHRYELDKARMAGEAAANAALARKTASKAIAVMARLAETAGVPDADDEEDG